MSTAIDAKSKEILGKSQLDKGVLGHHKRFHCGWNAPNFMDKPL